ECEASWTGKVLKPVLEPSIAADVGWVGVFVAGHAPGRSGQVFTVQQHTPQPTQSLMIGFA
ncbi:hypothetical protein, partial [Bifidobacterium longum]|uniref:hypothetical protein n=1 Tax=Bifidobacterium longum TaxID=216816 RepID=UPI001A954674